MQDKAASLKAALDRRERQATLLMVLVQVYLDTIASVRPVLDSLDFSKPNEAQFGQDLLGTLNATGAALEAFRVSLDE